MYPRWNGVFPAVATHFHEDLSLDLDATSAHIDTLLASGVSGIIMLGSLGENTSLTPDEKRNVLRAAIDTVRGRVPVLAGVAETCTALASTFAADAERLGADGLMLLPAVVYKSAPHETIAHYRTVAGATGLPIMVYNNPIAYSVDITPEMFSELADVPNLTAIKESSGITCRIVDIRNEVGDRFSIFVGLDDIVLEGVLLGAEGWVAGVGLAFPEENQRLWDLAAAGRWDEARDLYAWYMPLLHLDTCVEFVQKIKLAMQETGIGAEWVRQPRLPLAGEARAEVIATVRRALASRPQAAAAAR